MAISRRLRFEVLRRDGHTCRYCGAKAPDVTLTVDHVIPVTLGGGDEPNNLVTACVDCNAGKSSVPADAALVDDVDAAALLWAKAIERATAKRREDLSFLSELVDHFHRDWLVWTWQDSAGERHHIDLPGDWRSTIERFIALGLDPFEDFPRMIRTAMESRAVDEFRYFCKVAWNEIGARQELARTLLEDGEV